MNILLTSVGRRSYLVKYFKEALSEKGQVHVSNSSPLSPAFLYADKSVITPLIYEHKYIPFLKDYCINNKIKAIISLFDIDLPMLSLNKKVFEDIGVQVIVSNIDIINICNDKWKTYKFLIENGFNTPKTFLSIKMVVEAIKKGEINFPLMIKPRWGMGSIAVFEAENEDELKVLYNKTVSNIKSSYLKYESQKNLEESVIIQEKLHGQEYGLDIINNLKGEYQNTIVKKKYAMRSGETDCAETIDSVELKALGKSISKRICHIANMDVDIFVNDSTFYILELNARFGGGYPFSHIAGVNLPLAIIKWLRGDYVDKSLLSENIGVLSHKDIEMARISNGISGRYEMNKPIQVTRSSMPEFEEYTKEIKDLWDSHWLTNMGTKHKQLEMELSQYLNTPNVTLFTNGHLALECAIAALNLTGEVITTPFTFASTTHAIVRNGLKPVFCDIKPNDYTIDTDKIESLITDKTSAIIPVHVYGNICNVKEIERIAKKHNLKVIYDAAHTFGITVDGKGIANYGDASIFSFHATKVFNTIEGGAITFKNSELRKTLNDMKNFGITGPDSVEYIGGNAKMNEFQAAMGICNLRHVDEEINKRKAIVDRYRERLNDIKGIKLVQSQNGIKSNYAYFSVIFDGYKLNRDEVYDALKEENIFARKYFYPLTNSFECYKDRFNSDETPVAKHISERVLTLPLYADLALEDVDRICDIILNNKVRNECKLEVAITVQ